MGAGEAASWDGFGDQDVGDLGFTYNYAEMVGAVSYKVLVLEDGGSRISSRLENRRASALFFFCPSVVVALDCLSLR